MITRVEQDKDFVAALIPSDFLSQSIAWIASNMNPEDVFSEKVLKQWAEESGYVESE